MAVKHRTSGFTLAELSIVLVIIAVIIGAIFTGRQLIKASKMRSVVSQIDAYNGSVSLFSSKYNCLPGDCLKASSYYLGGGTSSVCHNGNGDGKISTDFFFQQGGGSSVVNVPMAEKYNLWCHLENAKMVPGNLPGVPIGALTSPASADGYFPPIKYGTRGYVMAVTMENLDSASPWSLGNSFVLFGDWPGGLVNFGTGWPLPALTAEEAFNLDSKIDDGLPATGIVRPVRWLGSNPTTQEFAPDDASGSGCVDTTSLAYDVPGAMYAGIAHAAAAYHPEYVECMLDIRANW